MSHLDNYLRIDDVPYQESTFLRICTQSFAKMNPAVQRMQLQSPLTRISDLNPMAVLDTTVP